MATAKKNIPALRFPKFKGEWEEQKLGDIATFSKGKGVSKNDVAEDGKYECIRYGELYTDYGEVIREIKSRTNLPKKDLVFSDYNDVIIPASGETQIDIATASCVLKDGVALGGDLNIIKTEGNGVVLAYYLNSKKKLEIAALAQGNSVVHLYANQLKTLSLTLPSDNEQQKIASFLSSVDERLQQLQQQQSLLEQYKKGSMQRLFSKKLRFKDSKGRVYSEWKEMILGNIFENRVEKGANEKSELLSVTINNGIKRHRDLDRINNSSDDKSSYLSVKSGDIVYNSMRMWQGASGISYWDGIVSPAYTVLKINDGFNTLFFAFLFKLDETIKIFQKHSQGLTSDTWNLKYNKFKNIPVIVPSFEEQTKIANFLSAIDEQINTVKQQIAQTQQFKKGLLQQLFV